MNDQKFPEETPENIELRMRQLEDQIAGFITDRSTELRNACLTSDTFVNWLRRKLHDNIRYNTEVRLLHQCVSLALYHLYREGKTS